MPDNSSNETPTIATDVTGSSAPADGSSSTPTDHAPLTAANFDPVAVGRRDGGLCITGFLSGRKYESVLTENAVCLCTPPSITYDKDKRSTRAPYMFGPSVGDDLDQNATNQDRPSPGHQASSGSSGKFRLYPMYLSERSDPSELLGSASSKNFVPDLAYRLNEESEEFKRLPHALRSHVLMFTKRLLEKGNQGCFLDEVHQKPAEEGDYGHETWCFKACELDEAGQTRYDMPENPERIFYYKDRTLHSMITTQRADELIAKHEAEGTYEQI